jgi:hypothetical protein
MNANPFITEESPSTESAALISPSIELSPMQDDEEHLIKSPTVQDVISLPESEFLSYLLANPSLAPTLIPERIEQLSADDHAGDMARYCEADLGLSFYNEACHPYRSQLAGCPLSSRRYRWNSLLEW